jgi:HEAT repeat protein
VDGLLVALKDPDEAVRQGVVEILGTIAEPRTVLPLLPFLEDPSWEMRALAAWALGQIGDPQVVLPLTAILGDWFILARQAAADALAAIGAPAIAPLIAVLKEASWLPTRREAARALGMIGEPALTPLITFFADASAVVRRLVAEALGQIGDKRAVPHLMVAFTDVDRDVRRAVAEALGRIGDPQSIPSLVDALWDKNDSVRAAAARSLDWMGWDPRWNESGAAYCAASGLWHSCAELKELALAPLFLALKDADAEIRQKAAETLGLIADRRALPVLLPALQDRSPLVRLAVVGALSESDEVRVIPFLAKALKAERISYVRHKMSRVLQYFSALRAGVRPSAEPLAPAVPSRPAAVKDGEAEGPSAVPLEEDDLSVKASVDAGGVLAANRSPFLLTVILLNLTGLGLGYLYMRRWLRCLFHLLVTVGLIVVAFLTHAAFHPRRWALVVGLWLFWMLGDGLLQARQTARTGTAWLGRRWVSAAVAGLFLVAQVGGIWVYVAQGRREYDAGLAAYKQMDCRKALRHFERLNTIYELTFHPEVATADSSAAECRHFLEAEQARAREAYSEAIAIYVDFLSSFSSSTLAFPVRQRMAETYVDWAISLSESGAYADAVAKYRLVLNEYRDTQAGGRASEGVARVYAQWALQLGEQESYEEVVSVYETILNEFPGTAAAQEAASLVARAYYEWATELRRQENPEEAVIVYLALRERYPATPAAAAAAESVAGAYLEWAAQLRAEDAYGAALDKYYLVLSRYPDVPTLTNARDEIIVTYFEWASFLREKALFASAIARYETVLREFLDSPAATPARLELSWTYQEWAHYLHDQGMYTEAMDKFALAQETTDHPEAIAAAAEGYRAALEALAADGVGQGLALMEETLSLVCTGEPAYSPAVGLMEEEPGRARVNSRDVVLTADLRAVFPGHFRYAICVEEGASEVQQCLYTDGHILVRQRLWWKTLVRDILDGQVIVQRTFYGSLPPVCPDVHSFWTDTEYMSGDSPPPSDINEWLADVLR